MGVLSTLFWYEIQTTALNQLLRRKLIVLIVNCRKQDTGLRLLLTAKPFGIPSLLLCLLRAALPLTNERKSWVLSRKHCPCCCSWVLFNRQQGRKSLAEGRKKGAQDKQRMRHKRTGQMEGVTNSTGSVVDLITRRNSQKFCPCSF